MAQWCNILSSVVNFTSASVFKICLFLSRHFDFWTPCRRLSWSVQFQFMYFNVTQINIHHLETPYEVSGPRDHFYISLEYYCVWPGFARIRGAFLGWILLYRESTKFLANLLCRCNQLFWSLPFVHCTMECGGYHIKRYAVYGALAQAQCNMFN